MKIKSGLFLTIALLFVTLFVIFFPIAKGAHLTGEYIGGVRAFPVLTRIDGTVKKIHTKDLATVKEGQILYEFEDPILVAREYGLRQEKSIKLEKKKEILDSKLLLKARLLALRALAERDLIEKERIENLVLSISSRQQELENLNAELVKLEAELNSTQNLLQRLRVVSPTTGQVYGAKVFQEGQFIPEKTQIAMIVNEISNSVFEAVVTSTDVYAIELGQPVEIRFSSLPAKSAPIVFGFVDGYSKGAISTSKDSSQPVSYTLRIRLNDDELNKLTAINLLQGMPIEALVKTGEQTILQYLITPLRSLIWRSFKEK